MTFTQDESLNLDPGTYLLKSGLLVLCELTEDGREIASRMFLPNDLFMPPLEEVELKALMDSEVCNADEPDWSTYTASLEKQVERFTALRRASSGSVRRADELVVLFELLANAVGQPHEKGMKIPLTHASIGLIAGTTRETVSTTVSVLARKKMLRRGSKGVYWRTAL